MATSHDPEESRAGVQAMGILRIVVYIGFWMFIGVLVYLIRSVLHRYLGV